MLKKISKNLKSKATNSTKQLVYKTVWKEEVPKRKRRV